MSAGKTTDVAQRRLETGTWPEVMAIFPYRNQKAPKVPVNEFEKLAGFYSKHGYAALTKFIELVQFEEISNQCTMSYNISLRPRYATGSEPTEEERMIGFLYTPDVLVGTRDGVGGAFVWIKNLSEVALDLAPASMQILDKIFDEVVVLMSSNKNTTTIEEILSDKPKTSKQQHS